MFGIELCGDLCQMADGDLVCSLPLGHEGPHVDTSHDSLGWERLGDSDPLWEALQELIEDEDAQ